MFWKEKISDLIKLVDATFAPPFLKMFFSFLLQAYLFNEGLVRFASEPFTLSPLQLGNPCVHLTNNEARDGGTCEMRCQVLEVFFLRGLNR